MAKRKLRFTLDIYNKEKDEQFRPKTHRGILTETEKTKFEKNKPYKGGSYYWYSGGGYSSTFSREQKQLCIFKSKLRYSKELNLEHLAYIQREGKGLNGQSPELYGAESEGYESRAAKLHFRFIISPKNQNVDLTYLTEELLHLYSICAIQGE